MTASDDLRQLPGELLHDLSQLARRFPDGFIERKDGIDYVAHHVVTQRLLSIVGPFDFELVDIIRGDVAPATPDPNGSSRRARAGTPALRNVVVGGVWRLTCTVDGRRVRIEEVGDVGEVHNWPHDGARLKDAASDALKRCAMRLGLGLHLWAQEHYFLDRQLRAILEVSGGTAQGEEEVTRRLGPGEGPGDLGSPAAGSSAGQAPDGAAAGAAGPAGEQGAQSTERDPGPAPGGAGQQAAGGRQRRDQTAGGGGSRRPSRGRRPVPADDSAQGAGRMPVRGVAKWKQPDEGLVERFDALVEAAGVSAADAREFLRRSPHYGGVCDPWDMHGPTLARLVGRMGQEGADGASGLAAFRAKVDQVLGSKSG